MCFTKRGFIQFHDEQTGIVSVFHIISFVIVEIIAIFIFSVFVGALLIPVAWEITWYSRDIGSIIFANTPSNILGFFDWLIVFIIYPYSSLFFFTTKKSSFTEHSVTAFTLSISFLSLLWIICIWIWNIQPWMYLYLSLSFATILNIIYIYGVCGGVTTTPKYKFFIILLYFINSIFIFALNHTWNFFLYPSNLLSNNWKLIIFRIAQIILSGILPGFFADSDSSQSFFNNLSSFIYLPSVIAGELAYRFLSYNGILSFNLILSLCAGGIISFGFRIFEIWKITTKPFEFIKKWFIDVINRCKSKITLIKKSSIIIKDNNNNETPTITITTTSTIIITNNNSDATISNNNNENSTSINNETSITTNNNSDINNNEISTTSPNNNGHPNNSDVTISDDNNDEKYVKVTATVINDVIVTWFSIFITPIIGILFLPQRYGFELYNYEYDLDKPEVVQIAFLTLCAIQVIVQLIVDFGTFSIFFFYFKVHPKIWKKVIRKIWIISVLYLFSGVVLLLWAAIQLPQIPQCKNDNFCTCNLDRDRCMIYCMLEVCPK